MMTDSKKLSIRTTLAKKGRHRALRKLGFILISSICKGIQCFLCWFLFFFLNEHFQIWCHNGILCDAYALHVWLHSLSKPFFLKHFLEARMLSLSLSSPVRPYFNWMLLFLHACISFHNKFSCIFCIMNCTAMDSNLEFGSAPLLSLYLDVTISESIKFYSMILKCYTIISQNKAAIHVFIFGIHNQR